MSSQPTDQLGTLGDVRASEFAPGELLSQETMQLLAARCEDLTNSICEVGFISRDGYATQESKDTGILAITALQAERALLRSLIERGFAARAALPRA